ncbi:Sporulation and spore germination [Raineyella antarctica]|uniref:Sporulation and spore germination n=1 Tax=Raineyella antarctica TaxID=1577474 RepID=A0A1G6GVR8_9ACTN|nr:LpqB family beta-propeller domain-containing protein [Raineyella antarctica]SDB86089.1 Sporulation and spore germination [Raineyella antarctica]
MTTRVRLLRVVAALALTLTLAGCVAIPRTGPVIRADQTTTRPSSQVEIAPQPPVTDASPRQVVEGFLQAMAAYEPDYSTARLYLAPAVRETWQPASGVTVYADGHAPTESNGAVVLDAPVVGRIDTRNAYTPVTDKISTDFGLQRGADGQWRIARPPQGLLVSQFVFENFFQHLNLYWPEPGGQFLVPDPVSMAQGRVSATTLVDALMAGPGDWIAPVVHSALPGGGRLNAPVSVDGSGVAKVDLAGEIGALDQQQRRLLVGQVTWTLGQLPTVKGVRFLHDGTDYPVGDLADQGGVVPIGALPTLSAVPSVLDNHLFAVSEGRVVRIDQGDPTAPAAPIAGIFGQAGQGPEGLAVTAAGDAVAVVTAGATRVTGVDLATGDSTFDFSGFRQLLRPQYARTGELWLVSGAPGEQRIQVVVDGQVREVSADIPPADRITAFRLSPDGVRLALVIESGGRSHLAQARIGRQDGRIHVDGLRVVPLVTTAQTELTGISDVGWIGPGQLVVLATTEEATQPSPYRLDPNAITVAQIGQADRWQATGIATLANPGTTRMVIVGDQGRAWRYEDDFTWPQVSRNVTAAAYPG